LGNKRRSPALEKRTARVFLDSGVLIAAFQGEPALRECALAILDEPLIDFWYSPLLKLEVTIQPAYQKHTLELQFYNEYFKNATCWGNLDRMFEIGGREAIRHGIALVDALHVATAHLARCAVLVTTEKPTKPMFRTELVKVVSIFGVAKPPSIVRKLLEA
jgi:predicted nucleic acid-binding protein